VPGVGLSHPAEARLPRRPRSCATRPEHASVLLDGLTAWMSRKGFTRVDELRGMLAAVPSGHEAERERAGYVSAMHEANTSAYGPW
jgi:dihydroorotate dehydrogenase (fumarate)